MYLHIDSITIVENESTFRVKKPPTVIREVLEGSMGQPYVSPNHPNITMLADDTFHRDNAYRIVTFGLVILSMPPFQLMSGEGPSW